MQKLSVIISNHLGQQLLEKARQIGVDNISNTVRISLPSAIENNDLNSNGGGGNLV